MSEACTDQNETPYQNYWVIWDIQHLGPNEILTIYLILPEWLDEPGRLFGCDSRFKVLYKGPMAESVGPVPSIPEPAVVTPKVVEEVTE